MPGSIRSSNSTTIAESPAGTMRNSLTPRASFAATPTSASPLAVSRIPRILERLQQLLMDAAESAVRHQHDEIAGPAFANDRPDDAVKRFRIPRGTPEAPEIAHQL